ncbi:ubiquitin-like domain-containing CTD phosphatase 1 [Neltuma alba]|uniref:ubiquitin-like domain-containing CTD phosphatase 1 n=1 Tax=Neltuma alba TaxID=207710 RepID=UPI0010A4B566|nr:ubiquitin-like domain-containing CTD phosphatase 1 [Prosopis alba]XP_028796601.1 ubiquitin-like domain-containing CTD phosphatase 1 [Prosopis alba]
MEHHAVEGNEPLWNIPGQGIGNTIKTDQAGSDNNLICTIPEEATSNPVKTDEARSDAQLVISNADEGMKISVSVSNEEARPELLRIPLVEPSIRCLKKQLLVLDINGLLADVVLPRPIGHKPDEIIAGRAIFKRPFYLEFLNFCFENFEVAVWSSRMKKNVDKVINCLISDMRHKLLFCWDHSHCTPTSFATLENKHKPLVFKDLRKIWEKHDPDLPWEKGYYNESNTLLLDDSPYKALLNPPHTSIFPYPYTYQKKGDNSLGVGGDLRVYLEGLVKAENMAGYIEQNPYGQERITERSPSWSFYFQVMGSVSTSELEKMSLSTDS